MDIKKHGVTGYRNGCRCEICVRDSAEKRKSFAGQEPPEHGRRGYDLYKCRCEICTKAVREYRRKIRESMFGRPPPKHGAYAFNYYGCRCVVCVAGERKERDKLKGKIPPVHGLNGYSRYKCRCKVCKEAKSKQKEQALPVRRMALLKRMGENPEKFREKVWNKSCIKINGNPFLWNDYVRLFRDSDEKCCICGKHLELCLDEGIDKKDVARADHNHETGEFRGILCGSCNRGIGLLKDSKKLLSKAIEYLDLHGSYSSYK